MVTSDLVANLRSLWPRTWDQKHNRNRLILLQQTADRLTGKDWRLYNRIIDAVEHDDFEDFLSALEAIAGKY